MGTRFTVINTSTGVEVVVEELRRLDLSTVGKPGDEYTLWESRPSDDSRSFDDARSFIALGRLH
jgi:hypothetical protein